MGEQRRVEDQIADDRAYCGTLMNFIERAWHILEPVAPFKRGWILDGMAYHLEAVHDGQITRLRMNVPPGSMKSLMTQVFFPAWEWGPKSRPDLRYINTSYAERYAKRDSSKMLQLVTSPWYQSRWGEGSPANKPVVITRASTVSFANTETGARDAIPFTSLTGGRADRLNIDDPHSIETAESEAERWRVIRTFRERVPNSLNDLDKSAIILIMQRLHQEDVSGIIDKLGLPYVNFIVPMWFEIERRCTTRVGWTDPRSKDGELMWPERFTPEFLKGQTDGQMTAYAIASQYQQRPAPREGGMFKREWFTQRVKAAPAIGKRVRRWDLAASLPEVGKDPDWSVGLKMLQDPEGRIFIEDVIRLRNTGLVVRQTIKNVAGLDSKRHGNNVRCVVPQDPGQAGKDQAHSLVRLLAGFLVAIDKESGDKAQRAEPFAAQCEAMNVWLVEPEGGGQWIEAFVDELCNFPTGHDDQVDAASGAFNFLTKRWANDKKGGFADVALFRG